VLPAEPTTPKVKPKVVKPVEKPAPTPAPEQDLEDVLAQMRAESGEEAPPTEIAKAAPAAIGPAGSPDGVAISPEVAQWLKRAKIHVRRSWVLPAGFRTQALEARVEVDLDASGAVRGKPKIIRKSGNPWYDDGVVRAIQKSSPLPAPPEAGKWNFVFLPEDSY
jgi:colicin import membrane protein